MADPARARKLAVRIRQIVSAAIEMQIKDPRLGMVTVTDAKVTGDLREATVFYTVYGDETQIADSAAALTSATGVPALDRGKADRHQVRPDAHLRGRHRPGHRPGARGGARARPARRRRAGPCPRGREVRRRGRPVPASRREDDGDDDLADSTRSCPALPMKGADDVSDGEERRRERGRPGSVRARRGPGRSRARRPRGAGVRRPHRGRQARRGRRRPEHQPSTSRTRTSRRLPRAGAGSPVADPGTGRLIRWPSLPGAA